MTTYRIFCVKNLSHLGMNFKSMELIMIGE